MNYESESLAELLCLIDEMRGINLEEVPGSEELLQEMKEAYDGSLNIREKALEYLSLAFRRSLGRRFGRKLCLFISRNECDCYFIDVLNALDDHDDFLQGKDYDIRVYYDFYCQ